MPTLQNVPTQIAMLPNTYRWMSIHVTLDDGSVGRNVKRVGKGLREEVKTKLQPDAFYSVGEAAQQLGGIKASTVKEYLRTGRLEGKKEKTVGFREAWQVSGASLLELRQRLGLDNKSRG